MFSLALRATILSDTELLDSIQYEEDGQGKTVRQRLAVSKSRRVRPSTSPKCNLSNTLSPPVSQPLWLIDRRIEKK
jgi:hypothetical protein